MRVIADSTLLAVEPGASTGITLDIVNTDDVIAGVSANIIGLATEYVSAQPQMLPLFPDASGKVHLDLNVPSAHPAGRHPLTVQVVSHGTTAPPDYIDVDLQVAAHPGLRLTTKPRIVRARRSGRFVLELANTGNVPLDVTMTGADPDRSAEVTFSPDTRRLEPNTVVPVLLTVRGPRMFTGAEIDRLVSIEATARPAYAFGRSPHDDSTAVIARIPAAPDDGGGATALLTRPDVADPVADPMGDSFDDLKEPEQEEEGAEVALVRATSVRLRQKPTVSRGLLTVFILLAIIALWAGAFLLGLAKVFAGDPMTKQAPASFFASSEGSDGNGAVKDANGSGGGSGGAAAANDAPAGALSKTGQVPPGTGGTITGKVVASTDQQPVGRIVVTAYRQGRDKLVKMSSAATQTDGTYNLSGLFPTSYYIQFSRTGFTPTWFPNQPTQATAQRITAVAQGKTEDINAIITGKPATITGKVDPGEARGNVVTVVTARPLLGSNTGKVAARTTTTTGGVYTLRNVPAPGNYQLTFNTPGYQTSTLVDSVSGGDNPRNEPTVTLGATAGQIAGTVYEGKIALGGATVTTTVGGKTISVGTPTSGQIGTYVLGNLPTPATYVVTVSSPGHGSVTRVVNLGAGASSSRTDVTLANGTGSLVGKVVGPDGDGLGGVTITVGGAATTGVPPTTTTLTGSSRRGGAKDPAIGQFVVNGLGSGSYTISATSDKYRVASVPVTLPLKAGETVTIQLAQRLGRIEGNITTGKRKNAVGGATVTATNGQKTFTTTTASSSGAYRFTDLDPGSYSVTVTAPGYRQRTALVTVPDNGGTAGQDIGMVAT